MKTKKFFVKALCLTLVAFLAFVVSACGEKAYEEEFNLNLSVSGSETDFTYVSYAEASYEERTVILGLLEKYAVENFITGISIVGNGGYALYNNRITKGSDVYIPGYGFGILTEGEITAPLAGETNEDWAYYYHTYETDDPKTLNYWNDKGSVVGGLTGYVHASYWTAHMNATKDGYVWVNDLANSKPVAVNPNENGFATKYRFEVKTSELKYNTLTTDPALAAFKGREVALEDYLTTWKELYNQSNGLARGSENLTGAQSIKGVKEYYEATKEGFNQAAWDNVGVKTVTEGGKNYIEIEFNNRINSFYAMYYINSSLYCPIPQAFVNEVGGMKNYASNVDGTSRTPLDTTLSTGVYTLEAWEDDKQIVFTKNDLYPVVSGKYNIEGIHVAILPAQKTDTEAALKEFLAEKLDACGIPSTQLDKYKTDERATQTASTANTKINLNTCDEEMWEYLFGESGTICTTPKADYWKVKPIMSNKNFLKGLTLAINRDALADKTGCTVGYTYFSDNYLSDPENGVSYNSTEAHANAIASLNAEGIVNGYSLEAAKHYFKLACDELIAAGVYSEGQSVTIEMAWQTATNPDVYGLVPQGILDAFNNCGGKLTLKITHHIPGVWSDVYYQKMMIGQFDIGFGSISGNALDPINFLEVLKSDNSSGFTLNWGVDTSVVSPDLVYDGKTWSFDSLFQAADSGAYVSGGATVKVYDLGLKSSKVDSNNNRVITFGFKELGQEKLFADVTEVKVAYYVGDEYKEEVVEITFDGETFSFKLSDATCKEINGSFTIYVTVEYTTITVYGAETFEKTTSFTSKTKK